MMNNQQVIDALRYCADDRCSLCNFCPAFEFCDMDYEKMMQLAASRMQNLMDGVERLKRKFDALEKEISLLDDSCIICKHSKIGNNMPCEENDFDCAHCKEDCACKTCDAGNNFEWNGMNAGGGVSGGKVQDTL